jgi:sugar-specific transcriptional regulator TrmB
VNGLKLFELAKHAIELIKSAGDKGYLNLELAKELDMPRRRIYDIIAILKAAKLVKTIREKKGTIVTWIGSSSDISNISSLSQTSYISEESNELINDPYSFKQTSAFDNTNVILSKSLNYPFSRVIIDSPFLKIRTTSKITRIKPIGIMELLVECEESDSSGFIIEAPQDENRKVKEAERALVDVR